jgi:di/tricarboxylate transporter
VSVVFGMLDISLAAISTVLVLLIVRSITFEKAKEAINWEVLFIIAGSFGIAKAMTNSGAADYLANHLLNEVGRFGPLALLAAAYLITNFLTELVTNNAAAVIAFPIIMSLVDVFSVNPEPFAVAIAIAASASFSTPIGYQTNLLVYSSGQYRFIDFLRVGLPLNIICFAAAIIIIPFIWPLT